MIDPNLLITILIVPLIAIISFLYYFLFRNAIRAALEEHQGTRFINRWIFVILTSIALVVFAFMAKPFWKLDNESVYQPSFEVLFFVFCGLLYLALEIPYQLVKMVAKDLAEEIVASDNEKRDAARLKSAQTLASIIKQKLKVACELQAFSSNEEFIFLTYIVSNKPIATRLKLQQADKAESWKKLGEWIMANYQKESPQQ